MPSDLSPRMHLLLRAPVPGALRRLAAPNVAATAAMTAVTFADAWYVGRLGTVAPASLALVFPFQTLMQMMAGGAIGGGAALTAAVGANFGARQYARARRFAWTGGGVTFLAVGGIGLAVAAYPALWLGNFTQDSAAFAFGALYLGIAGPCYGLFAGGQTLYFASQGTGRMALPVLVGLLRLATVAGVGVAAIAFDWGIAAVFGGVAAGLALIGVGLSLCLFSRAWRPDRAG